MRKLATRSISSSNALFWVPALLIAFTAASCPEPSGKQAPAVQRSIARMLALESVRAEAIRPRQPRRELPFVARASTPPLAVEHVQTVPGRTSPLPSRSFFTPEGKFLGAESLAVIDDPRRMTRAVVEEGMRNGKERIVAAAELSDRSALDALWQAVAKRIDVGEIEEYDLRYVEYELSDRSRRRMFVLNVWGPQNPLGMPEELPEVLKNRIRILYDVELKTLAADNLL
jgi:hypothetical protein